MARLGEGLFREHSRKWAGIAKFVEGALIIATLGVATSIHDVHWDWLYSAAGLLAVALFFVTSDAVGLYRPWRVQPLKHQLFVLWLGWMLVVPGLLATGFFFKVSEQFSRVATLLWFILSPTALTLWRVALRLALQELRLRGRNSRTVAIAGATGQGVRLAEEVLQSPWFGLFFSGFYDDRNRASGSDEAEAEVAPRRYDIPEKLGGVRGTFNQLIEDAKSGRIDDVYIALPLRAEDRIRHILAELSDTTVSCHVVTDLLLSNLLESRWNAVGPIPVLSVYDTPFHGVNGWLKRLEDLVLGGVGLLIAGVPMLLIAAAIKLTSKGPVFFRQHRYGLNGQPIEILKFRTMTVCEDGGEIHQAGVNDARITRLGIFLRRTSLDELPQLVNVLTGEMSLVGPRPHAVSHNEFYRRLIPGYMLRHKVKPGITGWAQVNGWRGETDTVDKMARRIEYDLQYIGGWGLWLDVKILLLTVFGSEARRNAR